MQAPYTAEKILQLIQVLRGPQGCAWDKKQTASSLTRYLLEETHELIAAIEDESASSIQDELGDVLLQVIFQSAIAQEKNQFTLQDVMQTLAEKLIRRHPHIFEHQQSLTCEQVQSQWQQIKEKEVLNKNIGSKHSPTPSFFSRLTKGLPSLIQAEKLLDTIAVAQQDNEGTTLRALKKAVDRVEQALSHQKEVLELELGELIWAVVAFAKTVNLDCELTLHKTCQRYCRLYDADVGPSLESPLN